MVKCSFLGLFAARLCLPCHDFLTKVLEKFRVQIHQLTSNARASRSSRSTIACTGRRGLQVAELISLEAIVLP
jgi:hypothetical protein